MARHSSTRADAPSLLWIYGGSLGAALYRARVLEMTGALAELGWHVTLAAADVPENELDERVAMLSLPRPALYVLGYLVFHLSLLYWLIRNGSAIDVMLLNEDCVPFVLPLVLLRPLLGHRIPFLVVDTRTLPMSTRTTRERLHAAVGALAHRAANRWADGQTVITRHLARAIGVPERQLLGIWPSGVSAERFRPAITLRQWPGSADPLRLVYIGSLRTERNLLGLCEAAQMCRDEGLNVTLQLVGDGPQRGELEAYAQQRGNGTIRVDPCVPHAEVPRVLAGADVGVLPFPDALKFRVSSPIKLFEYLASGMPILATRVVCHTDVLGNHDCVFWADGWSPSALAAAIRSACARKHELSQMGERSLALSQGWTWRQSAQRLDQALRRGLAGVRLATPVDARAG